VVAGFNQNDPREDKEGATRLIIHCHFYHELFTRRKSPQVAHLHFRGEEVALSFGRSFEEFVPF
jgi:hypothetical protein